MSVAVQRSGNLPAEVTSFVDRVDDGGEVRQLLGGARLVTITGVGGVGKTRFALHLAAQVQRVFADGVWLVDLAQLKDGVLVGHSILQVLGIFDDTGRDPVVLLEEFLRDRQLLLVMDNCEHVIDDCAIVVDALLRGAEGLRVLATSRQSLAVPGEHIYPLLPLPVPGGEPSWIDVREDADDGRCAAVTLFVQRATAVVPGFAVTADNRGVLDVLCRRLDGLPLALELAAARIRGMSLDQLLRRLDDVMGQPATRYRATSRHASLAAAVEWSHELCTEAERPVWARASVFAGHFDIAAAEHVCADAVVPDAGRPVTEVAECLAMLVDKSILLREDHGSEVRYRMLDTLRAFGRDQLRAAGQETEVEHRYADYHLRLAEQAGEEWFGPAQLDWFERLRCEHAHLRTALAYYLENQEAETALRMAATLWFYWTTGGALAEGRLWLDRALARHPHPDRVRATGLWARGFIAFMQGDFDTSVRVLSEARDIAQQRGEAALLARCACRLGITRMVRGDLESGLELLEEARERFEGLAEPDAFGMASTLMSTAFTRSGLGDYATAIDLGRRAAAICREHGDRTYQAYAMYVVAYAEYGTGEHQRATDDAREALRLRRALPDPAGTPMATEVIAWSAAAVGEYERAATLRGAAHRACRTFGTAGLLGSPAFTGHRAVCETRVREALGADAYQAAFRHGAELTLDEGITYAIGEPVEATSMADEQPPPTLLTRRETQVAELVAEGLTNRDIAARLLISRRTAETHVEHILTKLGLSNRTQIATTITQTPHQPTT